MWIFWKTREQLVYPYCRNANVHTVLLYTFLFGVRICLTKSKWIKSKIPSTPKDTSYLQMNLNLENKTTVLTSESGWVRVTLKVCTLSWPRIWLFKLYWLLKVFSQPSLGQLNGFSPIEQEKDKVGLIESELLCSFILYLVTILSACQTNVCLICTKLAYTAV